MLAATNRDLDRAVDTHQFRQDLFYRLNVIPVLVPPLREHRQDIPLLAIHFARKYSQRLARPFKGISPEARAVLINYSWPGNVLSWKMPLNTLLSWVLPIPSFLPTCQLSYLTKTMPSIRVAPMLKPSAVQGWLGTGGHTQEQSEPGGGGPNSGGSS